MLDYAMNHRDELKKKLVAFNTSPLSIYFQPWPYIQESSIEDNTWEKLQIVSLHLGKIQGYLTAQLYRSTGVISQISVAKFCEGHDLEFAADLAKIMVFLRGHYRHIRWSAIVGSPHEEVFARIARDQGGRTVGIFRGDACLRNGDIADCVWFEIPGTPNPDCSTVLPPHFAN